MAKYIFVTGGVLSGVGKGISVASIGLILRSYGFNVTAIKIDPYINVDAGTMNPYMHGEVFVTEDGGETDLDIGHYERFLGINLSKKNNLTTGKVYLSVIGKERRGVYLGQTVQIIPHITDEIKNYIRELSKEQGADITIVEIGGTVGDIEGLPFLEAVRQMRLEEGPRNTLFIHVALVPLLTTTGELKTKPLQHSVQELRRIGIQPDIVIARSPKPLTEEAINKIALYSNVEKEAVISNYDVDLVYEVPLIMLSQGIDRLIIKKLELKPTRSKPDLDLWIDFINRLKSIEESKDIVMVGKYTKIKDSYLSILEALRHASAVVGIKPNFRWVESSLIEEGKVNIKEVIERGDGVLILPGFGKRGAEGKIEAIKVARELGKPTLGICFGLQLMVIEFARNVLGLKGANSAELDPNTPYPVITLLKSQVGIKYLGGTLRLGSYKINIVKGTLAHKIYGCDYVYERHRHRYGINEEYIDRLEGCGFRVSGYSDDGIIEIMELKEHRFFVGTQAHPEFSSKPLNPSAMYVGFLKALA